MAPHPVLGYPSKTAAANAMIRGGVPLGIVAKKLGMPRDNVRRLIDKRAERKGTPAPTYTLAQRRPSSLVDEIMEAAERRRAQREEFHR